MNVSVDLEKKTGNGRSQTNHISTYRVALHIKQTDCLILLWGKCQTDNKRHVPFIHKVWKHFIFSQMNISKWQLSMLTYMQLREPSSSPLEAVSKEWIQELISRDFKQGVPIRCRTPGLNYVFFCTMKTATVHMKILINCSIKNIEIFRRERNHSECFAPFFKTTFQSYRYVY